MRNLPYDMYMKAVALLVLGLASVAGADEQFAGIPIRVDGQCSSRAYESSYVLRIKNVSNRAIEDLQIIRAGVRAQHAQYSPPLFVKRIDPKGCYTLRFTIRGSISPLPDCNEYGLEAKYRLAGQRGSYHSSFPGRKYCPPGG